MDLHALDARLQLLGAELAGHRSDLRTLLVVLATGHVAKALLFAPWLLVWWFDTRAGNRLRRQRVLATLGSCATALLLTWSSTSFWHRPRPLDPRSGLVKVSDAFQSLAHQKPGWLHWGCFPSDHAAYLTALGLGLFTFDRRVGTASLLVGLLGNGLARNLVGLHYSSDLMAGVLLGAFDFPGDELDKPIRVLSGGERSRLVLAQMLFDPPNFLVLDEPINRLDLATKEILVQTLSKFEGTMLFVSHDRSFLRGLATEVLDLSGGGDSTARTPLVFHGGYAHWVEHTVHEAPGVHR